ncbi:MAG: D-glycerate dehydrogenase [Nitratireductor sp.]|nr:D-glycerate dehydrogenase [Nitratireductor sp.]
MTNRKPKVIVTRRLPEAVEARMAELFEATFNGDDIPFSRAQLIEAVRTAECLVPTVTDRIDRSVLSQAGGQLKLIANFGNGTDNIDVAAAGEKGILVTNTPNVLTEDTADMTIGLMIAVARRFDEGVDALREGAFKGWSPTWMLGRRIWGKKLGIVGMGRIGTAVARRAKAFGLNIHYHNRNRVAEQIEQELEATYWESLDRMLAHMDIVSVNCPHTPATFHLISARRLQLMPPGSIIVNTARGEIIDQNALVSALQQGQLAGAGLDVLEHEPAVSPELMELSHQGKAVLLPHMGSATIEGRQEMGERVIINIRVFMDGDKPPDRVLPNMD